MDRTILFFLLFLLGIAATAQNRLVPGYIVLTNGDTLKGHIQLKGYYTAPEQVYYTKDASGQGTDYSVKNCTAFGTNDEAYQRWIVKIDMSTMNEIDYIIHYEDSTLLDTVFLKQVYKGKNLSLYKYFRGNERGFLKEEKEKMHFFLRDKEKMQELILRYKNPTSNTAFYKKMSVHDGDLMKRTTQPFYRDQLCAYFDWDANRKFKRQVDALPYQETSLLKAIKTIDGMMR